MPRQTVGFAKGLCQVSDTVDGYLDFFRNARTLEQRVSPTYTPLVNRRLKTIFIFEFFKKQ